MTPDVPPDVPPSLVGAELDVEIGPVAHGGHFVARHEGRVVFVRHALPGERVTARVTEGHEGSRFLRADVVEVTHASEDRVAPPCPYAGPGRCGGCDFQHIRLDRQRDLLAEVVGEQLRRLAHLEQPVTVEPVPGDVEGLGWRTRVRFTATPAGRPGLFMHRSHELVEVDHCRIADPRLPEVDDVLRSGAAEAEAVVTSTGDCAVVTDRRADVIVNEHALGRHWQVGAGDFWQVHPGAAAALATAVVDGLAPRPGDRCWDLYSGVGLLASVLADAVGTKGSVLSVESHRRAARLAAANLADLPQIRCLAEPVERFVRGRVAQGRLDLVVLDPPRAGAGAAVIRSIARQSPRAVAYVACDPAALSRDLATFAAFGYELHSLRAFDIFPMTHHVECVAVCRPRSGSTSAH